MNYLTKIQLQKTLAIIGVFVVISFISFASSASTVSAQYDDYSAPSYDSSYSGAGYGSDYSAPSYYSDYSGSSYSSNYSAPSYTSDYSSPMYASDYSAPSYTSDYSAPSYTSDYSAPSYTSDYSAPSYTSDYSAPTYTSDYSAPSYTSDYSAPSYTSDYSAPTYNNTYSPGYTTSCGGGCYQPTYYPSTYYPSTYVPGTTYYPPVSNPRPQPIPLSGSCVANPGNANVNDTVTWSVTGVSGGAGNYLYSWTGTDGLFGNASSISKIYSVAGTKSATVTIRSGNQSIVRTCTNYVNTPYIPPVITPVYNNLSVSCAANQSSATTGNYISWTASAYGGNGAYSYSWTGTDGLYSNSSYASMLYNTSGTKYAYVTVYSNGQSATANCSLYVNNPYFYNPTPIVTYVNPQPPVYAPYVPYNGVSLAQVPYTGLTSNMNIALFVLMLLVWSAAVTYIVVIRRKAHNSLVTETSINQNDFSTSSVDMDVAPRQGAAVYWPQIGGTV